jgi:hypothetical protein
MLHEIIGPICKRRGGECAGGAGPASGVETAAPGLRGRKEEQKIKSDITAALRKIEEMQASKKHPQTLQEFLREL